MPAKKVLLNKEHTKTAPIFMVEAAFIVDEGLLLKVDFLKAKRLLCPFLGTQSISIFQQNDIE